MINFYKKNKNIFVPPIIFLAAVLFIILYVKLSTINFFPEIPKNKFIDISYIRIVGWENGKKSWEMTADKAYTTKDRNITEFENIKNGIVYKNGNIVMKNISAPHVLMNSSQNQIDATAPQTGKLNFLAADISLREAATSEINVKNKPEFSKIKTPHLIYNSNAQITYTDNVSVSGKKYFIKSGKSEIHHSTSTAIFMISPIFKSGNYTVKSSTIEVDFKEDKVRADGNIVFKISGKNITATEIRGKTLFFSMKSHDAQIADNVELLQKGKKAYSNYLSYSDKMMSAQLTRNVRVLFKKGGSLLSKQSYKKIKNPEARKALQENALLTCNVLNLSIKTGSATAEGNVIVEQKNKKAKSDYASYDDEKENIAMIGSVFIEKGKEWVKSRSLLFSLPKGNFEALGNVKTRFILKK